MVKKKRPQGGYLCLCQALKKPDLSAKTAATGFPAEKQKKAKNVRIQNAHP
ncbi:MAG: hypothetical protein J5817_04340 [Treponema sp.]|nr:hypothetical protein [Treponema sp.]